MKSFKEFLVLKESKHFIEVKDVKKALNVIKDKDWYKDRKSNKILFITLEDAIESYLVLKDNDIEIVSTSIDEEKLG